MRRKTDEPRDIPKEGIIRMTTKTSLGRYFSHARARCTKTIRQRDIFDKTVVEITLYITSKVCGLDRRKQNTATAYHYRHSLKGIVR